MTVAQHAHDTVMASTVGDAQGVQDTTQQKFREAYLNTKLGRAFEDGQPWATTDLNGLELSVDSSRSFRDKYADVSSPAQMVQAVKPCHSPANMLKSHHCDPVCLLYDVPRQNIGS